MKDKIPTPVFVGAIVLAVVFALYLGYRASEPPAAIHGIGRDGKPMSDADAEKLMEMMSGGKHKAQIKQ